MLCCLTRIALAEGQTLEEAWIQAYRNNPSLEAQRAELRAVDEAVAEAKSHWRPSIDANGGIGKTRQYTPDGGFYEPEHFYDKTRSYGLQVTQPLFRGFRTIAETEAAEQKTLAGRARLAAFEQQLFLDTASSYLNVLRDQDILLLQHGYEKVLRQKLAETQARSDAGELTKTDLRQAESRLARAQANRFQLEESLAQGRAAFARLTGDAPRRLQSPRIDWPLPPGIAAMLHLAETRAPEVIAAEYDVQEAKAEIQLNAGNLLPELNLVGNSGRSWGESATLPGRSDTTQVTLQLSVPLYRSGADYARIRAARETREARADDLEEARHKAREAADNAWQALATADAALNADDLEAKAAEKALEGVKAEAEVGTRTTLDVLNAEQELLDARIDRLRSRHDRDFALLRLRAAAGDLTAERLRLATEKYDPKRHYEEDADRWAGLGRNPASWRLSSPPLPSLPPSSEP